MATASIRDRLARYDPHPEVTSAAELRALHNQVRRIDQLRRRGIPLAVVPLVAVVSLVGPAVVLRLGFGVEHLIVSTPVVGIAALNVTLIIVAFGLVDSRLGEMMIRIRPAFAVDDTTYYGFQGRLFEQLYTLSMGAPLFPGPSDRWYPRRWLGVYGVTVLGLAGIVAAVTHLPAVAMTPEIVVFYAYAGFQILFSGFTILTLATIAWVAWVFMTVRVTAFPINLDVMRVEDRFGLRPYGQLLLAGEFPGFVAAAASGVVGVLSGNLLLLVTATIATVGLVVIFVGAQYGIHRAIVASKQARLESLREEHRQELDQVFHHESPEPDIRVIEESESFLAIKREIESLPTWPTASVTTYQLLSTFVISNVPFIVEFVVL